MPRPTRFLAGSMLFVLAGCAHPPSAQNPPLVILVSIDGFRADYLERGLTPNIAALAAASLSVDHLARRRPGVQAGDGPPDIRQCGLKTVRFRVLRRETSRSVHDGAGR